MSKDFPEGHSITYSLLAHQARGESITFVFDHYTVPPHVFPHTPIPGGPFGTLTFTDSAVDPNRVDVDLTITPPGGYSAGTLEQFYINFVTPFLTNHQFYLVDQSTPATGPSNNPFPGGSLGNVGYFQTPNVEFADFIFDVRPNPTSGAQTFTGSLSLYNELPAVDTPVNLDVSMFNLTAGLSGVQTLGVYAAYRTNVVNPAFPDPDGEFWAFATSVVPEPGSVVLMAAGMIGLCAWGVSARRRNAISVSELHD